MCIPFLFLSYLIIESLYILISLLLQARPIQCTQGPARLGCIYLQGFRNRRSVLQSSSLPPLINGSENSEFSNPTPVSTRSSTESSLSTPPPISTNQASSNFPPPSPPPLESGIPPLALRSGSSPQPPQSTGSSLLPEFFCLVKNLHICKTR